MFKAKLLIFIGLSFFSLSTGFSQCALTSTASTTNSYPEIQIWPVPDAEGPFVIKVQFVDVQNGTVSSIPSGISTSNILATLNSEQEYFGGHGIKFQQYPDSVIAENPTTGLDPDDYLQNFTSSYDNRIYIFFGLAYSNGGPFSHNDKSFAVTPLPSTKAFVATNNNISQKRIEYLVAHELGHALGLLHTWDEDNDINPPQWAISATHLGETGDLIADTPPHIASFL